MTKLALLPLALMLGGCNIGLLERNYVSRADTIPVVADAPASVGTIPVNAPADPAAHQAQSLAALAMPEGAGHILKVRERHYVNGTRQEIILAADKGTYGENVIDVSIRTSTPSHKHTNPMQIGPPTENGMRSEILSRFPDVQMNIVTRPMRNSFGPFGLAIGRHASGSRCIFAWQWIEDLRDNAPGSNLTKLNGLMAGRQLATSVRIRLCRGDQTVDQLAAQIEALKIASPAALERLASMDRRDLDGEVVPVSGGADPRGQGLLRPVTGSLEAAMRPARREPEPAQQAARQSAPPPRQAAKPAPKETPRQAAKETPPPAPKPRRQPASRPAPEAPPALQATPAYEPPAQQASGPYGQRYLAPVAGATPAYAAPGPAAPVAGAAAGLPPQAYRGPAQ